jgi:hypothetical protein
MKSNNILIVTALTILITCISSCQDSFLDENPESFLSPTNFYNTEADANAAIVAVYNGLRPIYSQDITFVGDLAGEQTWPGVSNSNVDRGNLDNFVFEAKNTILLGNWNNNYIVIDRANAVIDRVPAISMPTDKKDNIIGEAHFLRALCYFNLVRQFGGVPLRLQETTDLNGLDLARSSVSEVYDVIIDDLKQAETKLLAVQPATGVGRATKGAASTMLAYLYLTKKDWANAASKAQEVIDNKGTYGYGLFATPADVWKIANENKTEHIFSIQFQSGPEAMGSAYAQFYLSRTANVIQAAGISGFGQNLVEDAFWKSFNSLDKRRDASILSNFTDPKTNKVYQYPSGGLTELSIFKYFDAAPYARSNNNNNYPILRYADVLLIKAEALNELNGPTTDAYDAINLIRVRAGGAGMVLTSGLSQVDFRAAVLKERSWEFCFESKRYFDLIRTEQLIPIMTAAGKTPQPKNLLFPIPQTEIDVNKKINPEDQNPGY